MRTQPRIPGTGVVFFTACILVLAGIINVWEWFVALVNSKFYTENATFVFADLRTWGWIQLLVGLVQLLAFFAILNAQPWGRWLGIAIAGVSVLAQLFFVNASPWVTLVVIAIDLIIIYALARYGVEPFER
jgi:hypothetical protein